MEFGLSILYYSMVIAGILFYLIKRDKELSMSDFIMVGNTILFSFAGVKNSYGIYEGYNNFDCTLYLLYLANATLVPIGLIFGKKIKVSKFKHYYHEVNDRVLYCVIIFVLVYALGYFWIIRNNIPLLLLLSGRNVYEVATARLQVTHNFSNYYSVPFIYRYRSLVFSYICLYSFSLLFVKYLKNKQRYRKIFWLYLFATIFIQFYATEKVPLIYLIIIIVIDFYLVRLQPYLAHYRNEVFEKLDKIQKKKTKRKIVFFGFIGFVGLLFMYVLFMGAEDFYSGFLAMAKRAFFQQSSSIYLQKITLDSVYGGCLYGKGFTLTILDSLLGRTPINLSKMAYETQYAYYLKDGGAGSAGSLGVFYLYSNVGMIIALILLFVIAMVSGCIDRKMKYSIEYSENNELPIAYYSMITYVLFQGYLGHYQTFFQLPFIIAPYAFIVIFMTFCFKKMSIGK